MSALTAAEKEIGSCLNNARANFLRVAELIVSVRDDKLYLEAFQTFEEWCETGMGWTKRRANQLISGAETVNDLPPSLAAEVTTESEARALKKLDREDQKKVIREAKQEGVSITSKAKSFSEKPAAIGQKQGTVVPGKSEDIILDRTGEPVPKALLEMWERRDDVEKLSREVASFETKMIALQDTKDPLWIGLNANQAVMLLQKLHQCIAGARLHAVCITCGGRAFKQCAHCKGKGILSKFAWDTGVDQQAKDIRARARAAK